MRRDWVSHAGLFAVSTAEERAAMSDSKIDDGGPAFPVPNSVNANIVRGMTLRDWFAGQALAAIIANEVNASANGDAADAYMYADAMLKARNAQ